jgi:hypothetical protein
MKKVTEETSAGKSEARPSGLDDLIQQGARQIVQQAIEAELAALLERYDNVKTLDGRRTVIRNGYLPEREIVTAIGPVTVKVPKVRDRSLSFAAMFSPFGFSGSYSAGGITEGSRTDNNLKYTNKIGDFKIGLSHSFGGVAGKLWRR